MNYLIQYRDQRIVKEFDNITQAEDYVVNNLELEEGETVDLQAQAVHAMVRTVKKLANSRHWNHPGFTFQIQQYDI